MWRWLAGKVDTYKKTLAGSQPEEARNHEVEARGMFYDLIENVGRFKNYKLKGVIAKEVYTRITAHYKDQIRALEAEIAVLKNNKE